MTVDEILRNARWVNGNACIDQSGDLLYVCHKEDAALKKEIVTPEVVGFDIVGERNDLIGFDRVFITRARQYIARLGASYFLIDTDGRLLSEGGHTIVKRGDWITTGYGADMHTNSGKLNPDLKGERIDSVFYRPNPSGLHYARKR